MPTTVTRLAHLCGALTVVIAATVLAGPALARHGGPHARVRMPHKVRVGRPFTVTVRTGAHAADGRLTVFDFYGHRRHKIESARSCSHCQRRFLLHAVHPGRVRLRVVLVRHHRILWHSRILHLHVVSVNTTSKSGTASTGTTNKNPVGPNPNLGSQLTANEQLTEGQYLTSPNGSYRLVMQGDGNLVEYQSGGALWASNTAGHSGAYAVMQGDGNLVVYQGSTPLWASNTAGYGGDHLVLQNDSNLVIYQDDHPLWDRSSGYEGDILYQGITLHAGDQMFSPNHAYMLVMQGDGNLVEYQSGKALWASNTAGHSGAYAVMQGDGNLVVYQGSTPLWASGTNGDGGARLVMQSDGNLVIYLGGTAKWDRYSGVLGGSGSGPTQAEQQAVAWAKARLGSTAYNGLCLTFVYNAYLDGAGINLESYTSGVSYNSNTYPQDVWGHFARGTTGTGTPPYGALVFFNAKPGYSIIYSHVMIMGSSGEMISTSDAFDESAVHYETLSQEEHSGAYATYVGWWLPDG